MITTIICLILFIHRSIPCQLCKNLASVATITAAIPPALALGPGAETRGPMAMVIIGGVSVSALLTLFVVPCAYSLMSHLESHRHDAKLKEALQELGELPS